jgi:hypothetical protein
MEKWRTAADIGPIDITLTMPVLVTRIREGRTHLKNLQEQHIELREHHLRSLAEARLTKKLPGRMSSLTGEKRNTKIRKEIRRIQRRETIKEFTKRYDELYGQEVISAHSRRLMYPLNHWKLLTHHTHKDLT